MNYEEANLKFNFIASAFISSFLLFFDHNPIATMYTENKYTITRFWATEWEHIFLFVFVLSFRSSRFRWILKFP